MPLLIDRLAGFGWQALGRQFQQNDFQKQEKDEERKETCSLSALRR